MTDSSLPLVALIWVTISGVFTHFTYKKIKGWLLRNMTEVRIKLDKMFKDKLFFSNLYYLLFFLRNLAIKLCYLFIVTLGGLG
jgi:hypothetical protein